MQFSEQIIKDIKRGKQQALEDLYCAERSPFLAWARKYLKCSSQDAKELYQVTILIAYDNIVIGRLEELRCSFKSYLYAIAKNKWKEWQRARIKMKKMDDYFFEQLVDHHEIPGYPKEVVQKLARALSQLGDPCQKLLTSFYYHKLSMEQISEEMNYKNASTTKNLKYKCLQRLKNLVFTSLNKKQHAPEIFST
jgi:RNA polymerase sigma-70 factor (ECF subfamily)